MCQLMTTRTGETIPVETNKELCSNFKFQPEDKIKHPEFGEATVKGIGKDFKNAAKKRANSELKPHERTGSEKNKAIKRKWGTKVIEENVGATALVWNSARHFHLIENGHNLVRGGRIVGFVPGKHIMEKTRNEYENIVPQRFEEMIDEILKEGDLN